MQEATQKEKELLTAEEAMSLLSIGRYTFDCYKKDGILKVYRLRRKLYLKRSEIMDALRPVSPDEKQNDDEK